MINIPSDLLTSDVQLQSTNIAKPKSKQKLLWGLILLFGSVVVFLGVSFIAILGFMLTYGNGVSDQSKLFITFFLSVYTFILSISGGGFIVGIVLLVMYIFDKPNSKNR